MFGVRLWWLPTYQKKRGSYHVLLWRRGSKEENVSMGVAGGHMQPVRTPLGIVDGPVALAWCTAGELTG
jgi:hypothetical protein